MEGRRRREVDTPTAHSGGDATQRSGNLSPAFFIKNVRDGKGNWVTDEMKPNISFISKRLAEMPTDGMGDDWVFSIFSESNRMSTEGIDKKGKKFFMIPKQSIIHGELRFPLKKFFIEVLRGVGDCSWAVVHQRLEDPNDPVYWLSCDALGRMLGCSGILTLLILSR